MDKNQTKNVVLANKKGLFMIIDLPPHIEKIIINEAQIKGISVADLISQKFADTYPKGDIRRLKGIAKSDVVMSLEQINEAIVDGVIHGE